MSSSGTFLEKGWDDPDDIARQEEEERLQAEQRRRLASQSRPDPPANDDDEIGDYFEDYVGYGDLTEDSASAPELVKKLLILGTLFVVYGESNCGKTFWLLDLCLAIAAGIPWRGSRRTHQGLVIYVAGEGPKSVIGRGLGFRLRNPEIPLDIPFVILPRAVNFMDAKDVKRLLSTARCLERFTGFKTVLIVCDTLARSMPGGDENFTKDMGQLVAAADRLRNELGCCVGFVHHAGKDKSKGARGSNSLRAACDTEILVEGLQGARTVTVTKQRDLDAGAPMAFELVPIRIGTDEDGEAITTCTVTHKDPEGKSLFTNLVLRGRAQRTLVAALRARSETEPEKIWTLFDLRQVGKELGLSKTTARSAVDSLVSSPYMQATIGGYRFVDGSPRS